MRLGFWRCDHCPNWDQKPNDNLNRKDLFMQHLPRMHPVFQQQGQTGDIATRHDDSEDLRLTAAVERGCVRVRGLPESTNCIFCGQVLEGLGSRSGNLQHVAKHMEHPDGGDIDPKDWERRSARSLARQ